MYRNPFLPLEPDSHPRQFNSTICNIWADSDRASGGPAGSLSQGSLGALGIGKMMVVVTSRAATNERIHAELRSSEENNTDSWSSISSLALCVWESN